jgi:predicted AlkP superfamily phosphohydrolase/phosphomutase
VPSPCRILFIGVDAAEKDLVLQWAAEGALPAFRSLLERGAWGLTQNPEGFYVGAVWPSFWTGLSPAGHGRYCYSQIRTGTYDHYRVTPMDTKGRPFWERIDARGGRVAIIDVPKTRPSRLHNGIQIVDWGTHDPELDFCAWPEPLAGEIAGRFGAHPVRQCDEYVKRGPHALVSLRDDLVRGVGLKAELAASLLQRGGWDLFLTVFTESHCVGHQLWHVRDPSHPRHDPELAGRMGDPVKDVYVAIDQAIACLVGGVGPETLVCVLLSHGMGSHCDVTFLLDAMLRRLAQPRPGVARRAAARVAEWGWASLPEALRSAMHRVRAGVKRSLADAVSVPDPATRRCFATPNNDVFGGIRINLVGREPQGLVRPGPECDAFVDQLSEDLLSFVNLDTGRPLVRRVLRTADLYPEERVDHLPDLLVEWDRDSPALRVESPRTGLIVGHPSGRRSGEHRPEGLLITMGPSTRSGQRAQMVPVTRLGPALVASLGMSHPNIGGDFIEEMVRQPDSAGC